MPDRDPFYDLIVIGAGPAGAEAALAAAGAGSRSLCLAINLDTTGYLPGSPLLAAGTDDPRRKLLAELAFAGAALPQLLKVDKISRPESERIVVDRRQLGLAYKELLETTAGVDLRQALVVSIQATNAGWRVTGKLSERFGGRALVIATGTFLQGRVVESGAETGGGRRGEIPANALAKCLQSMGILFIEAEAVAAPRFDCRRLPEAAALTTDDSRLGEVYGATDGSPVDLPPEAWATRPPLRVRHLMLAAGQVSPALESPCFPGLYFAGRAAGASGYVEAAALGALAGCRAAMGATTPGRDQPVAGERTAAAWDVLINNMNVGSILCQDIAAANSRPVSARKAE